MDNKSKVNISDKQKLLIKRILIVIVLLFVVSKLGWIKVLNISKAILLLGILIFIHELGHFLIAKATKVPVHKFAVGMGSKIFSKQIGETEYSLRIIPLGGFVQLELEDELDSENGSSFRKLNPFKRFAVYSAGAIFNFIFAFVLIVGILFSKSYPTTTIGEVFNRDNLNYDLKAGDEIVGIGDIQVKEWNDVLEAIETNTENVLEIETKRDGKLKTVKIDLSAKNGVEPVIGITPKYEKNLLRSITDGVNVTAYNIKRTAESLIDALTSFVEPITSKLPVVNNNSNSDKNEQKEDVELTGPIGTIDIISEQMNKGIQNYMSLMASISISLGVFNLLPIPGLDGGRMFLIIIELLRGGKQLTINQELKITMVGAFSLLAIMIITTIKDIVNLL